MIERNCCLPDGRNFVDVTHSFRSVQSEHAVSLRTSVHVTGCHGSLLACILPVKSLTERRYFCCLPVKYEVLAPAGALVRPASCPFMPPECLQPPCQRMQSGSGTRREVSGLSQHPFSSMSCELEREVMVPHGALSHREAAALLHAAARCM